jgi:hypothetical protein|tara:strand:+ start:1707 stop:2030 length:324 start_codon:yes stop_codon:yes gene_type:complete
MSKPKGGPLSKAEKFYIANNVTFSDEDFAKDLNRSPNIIEKYRSSLPKNEEPTTKVSDLMARTDKGATTMTEAASMLTDEKKQVTSKEEKKSKERSFRGSIHRIKEG